MSKKILVADDESHILNVVSLKLRNAGFEVVTAGDGGEAFALARQERPALLITDYHMPLLNGVDVCRKLREEESGWDVPAIMLTARGSELTPAELEAGGIVEVVSKPFSPRELLAVVARHLQAA